MRDQNERNIELFLEMLSAERGAAQNTLEAYGRDLEHFDALLRVPLEHRCPIFPLNRSAIISACSAMKDWRFRLGRANCLLCASFTVFVSLRACARMIRPATSAASQKSPLTAQNPHG